MLAKAIFFFFLAGFTLPSFSQTYFNESGKQILYSEYEDMILNRAYFGIPADEKGNMKLVHRMPVGITDSKMIYEKLGLQQEFSAGQPLIVIYYPGKDELNSTGLGNTPSGLKKSVKTVARYAKNHDAVPPLYIYKNPHGLEKYQGIQDWKADPDQLFEKLFFPYTYPSGSFVVISPKGNFRGILGEYPLSQIDVALKKL
ncbi:hypothetical protein [Algoriphagus sp. A40]|uniref:hypothetical protein n=1 Tax=Algoriphagus sp. A40 TaxID=1945863 RepID=UPI000985E7BD|nr:hypothetical protein [Algoriphagus sp. A40]OOG68608.1 hypothetical protein B0E43_22195 [Algoriphagus sp. A40]